MIVLDTNVVSEPLRPSPSPRVVQWLTEAAEHDPRITAITVAEVLTGIAGLPTGRRRSILRAEVEALFAGLAGRVLDYDPTAARLHADLQADRRSAGAPLGLADGMVASICLREGAQLATRNPQDFTGLGLTLLDPWEPA